MQVSFNINPSASSGKAVRTSSHFILVFEMPIGEVIKVFHHRLCRNFAHIHVSIWISVDPVGQYFERTITTATNTLVDKRCIEQAVLQKENSIPHLQSVKLKYENSQQQPTPTTNY
mmetsp:Transcript_20443/g.41864  ORF Transcript_20443/g.41864 Transcript_20443/m.41864 type:complete len:116 (+) Transcript_20443:3557-3904(+)